MTMASSCCRELLKIVVNVTAGPNSGARDMAPSESKPTSRMGLSAGHLVCPNRFEISSRKLGGLRGFHVPPSCTSSGRSLTVSRVGTGRPAPWATWAIASKHASLHREAASTGVTLTTTLPELSTVTTAALMPGTAGTRSFSRLSGQKNTPVGSLTALPMRPSTLSVLVTGQRRPTSPVRRNPSGRYRSRGGSPTQSSGRTVLLQRTHTSPTSGSLTPGRGPSFTSTPASRRPSRVMPWVSLVPYDSVTRQGSTLFKNCTKAPLVMAPPTVTFRHRPPSWACTASAPASIARGLPLPAASAATAAAYTRCSPAARKGVKATDVGRTTACMSSTSTARGLPNTTRAPCSNAAQTTDVSVLQQGG